MFLERVKKWAISKLRELYEKSHLFNKPIVFDENRHYILGLMQFYKFNYRDLFSCEDWQDILMQSYTTEVGKHLITFSEFAICKASPLDFDRLARAGKKFSFTNESKKMFIFWCNEMYLSGAKTTASFFDITPPVSLTKLDEKIKDMNKRLAERSIVLEKKDKEEREKRVREENEKKRTRERNFPLCVFFYIKRYSVGWSFFILLNQTICK